MSDEELKTSDEPDSTDDEGDEAGEAEFDENLVIAAKSVGLNPDNFDNEEDLYRETEVLVIKKQAASVSDDVDDKQEALEMAALEVSLSNKDDLDAGIVKSLEAIAKGSGENFNKLAERLQSGNATSQQMRRDISALTQAVQGLNAENNRLVLNNWIRDHEKAQGYLGKPGEGDLDPDGKFARRGRSMIRKALAISKHQQGRFTAEQMLGKAFKKMQKPGTEKTKGKKSEKAEDTEPTRLARASGTTTSDLVGGDSSEAALKAEATSVVAKARRNSR